MEGVLAFSTVSNTLFGWANRCILAFAVARYIAAFLTPKKHSRLFAACVMGAVFAALDFVSGIVPWNEGYWPSVKDIAISLLMFLATTLLYRREYLKQLFLLLSFHSVMRICNNILSFLGNILPFNNWFVGYIYSLPDLSQEKLYLYLKISIASNFLFYAVIYALLIFASLYGLSKSFTYKNRRLGGTEAISLILPCIPVFVINHVVAVFFTDLSAAISTGEDAILMIQSFYRSYVGMISLALIFLLFILIVSVRMVQRSARLHMEATDAAILREQMRELQKRDTDGVYAEIRGMRHDMKNHLGNMSFLLESATNGSLKSAAELGAYVAKMSDTLDRFEFAFHTGSSVIDAVIHGRYLTAKRKDIQFSSEFVFPASSGIDAYDLAVILQNALDNACESCGAAAGEHRFIHLRSSEKASTLFIEISNSYAGGIAFDGQTGLPLTAKQDGGEHGLGISNIKRAAEKYGGDIDIKLSESNGAKVFALTVVLPFNRP